MEDDTAEGSTARYRNPSTRLAGSHKGPSEARGRISSGNTAKVMAKMKPCRRHWVKPAITASRGRAAPWTKNRTATPSVANCPNHLASSPWAGQKEATTTVSRINQVNVEIRNFFMTDPNTLNSAGDFTCESR